MINNIFILGIVIFFLVYLNNNSKKKVEKFSITKKNINKSDLTLIGFISNKYKKKKIYKLYTKKGIYYFIENGKNSFKSIKKLKNGDKVIYPNEKPYTVQILPYDYFNDKYALLSKYKINVPYIIEDYKYMGVLENAYVPGKYYLYGKQINFDLKLYNYLIYSKTNEGHLKLVSVFTYQNRWFIGDPVRFKVNNNGPYGLFIIAP
jgi:hypothetical protein